MNLYLEIKNDMIIGMTLIDLHVSDMMVIEINFNFTQDQEDHNHYADD